MLIACYNMFEIHADWPFLLEFEASYLSSQEIVMMWLTGFTSRCRG
jgi:hypothetical protein